MSLLIPRHRHFIDGDTIAYDSETTGTNPWKGDCIFTFSFANEAGDEWCFEFPVDPFTRKPKPDPKILERVRALLEDPCIRKIGFNKKFDEMMADVNFGIKVAGRTDDVMWMSHVCNSSELKHALKPLSDKYSAGEVDTGDEKELGAAVKACRLQAKKLHWKIAKEETGEEKDSSAYKADYWLPKAAYMMAPEAMKKALLLRWPNLRDVNRTYAIKDARRTMLLAMMYTGIMDEEDLWRVYERELRMAPVTYRAEKTGIRVFPERCAALDEECRGKLTTLRTDLSKIFGEFKVEVPDAKVRNYLYGPAADGGLELPVTIRTEKTKQPSVAKEAMAALALKHNLPVFGLLEDYAKYRKVRHDYIQKYTDSSVDDGNGQQIIHAGFQQIGATTGRMSIRKPPLHQAPKRAKAGDIMKRARYPLGPRKGCIWIHHDYKSIEPRILAEESDEKDIIRIFGEGGDPYLVLVDSVAQQTGFTVGELDAMFESRGKARQVCKNNFLGWTYGEGIRKLASQMGCSLEVAEKIIHALQATFSGVAPFMRDMQALAKRQGYIRNRYGRKCVIPPPSRVFDAEMEVWKWVEWWYKATNYLIQGTAADMLKEAAIRLGADDHHYAIDGTRLPQKAGYLRGTGCEMLLFVHDEIIIEVPFYFAVRNEKFIRGIGDVMADNCGMFTKVKTPVDAKVSWYAWSDPEELETIWN